MEKEAISLDRYAGKDEAVVVRRIVRLALAKGWSISVNDGGEWVVRKSTDRMEVLVALATTGQDLLMFHDPQGNPQGKQLGWFHLIYQGGDNDGTEVVSDYVDNPLMEALYKEAMRTD